MASHAASTASPDQGQSLKPSKSLPHLRRVVHVVRGRPGPDDRPALPSGHPDTWGLITAGTCIEGLPYPFPVFPR